MLIFLLMPFFISAKSYVDVIKTTVNLEINLSFSSFFTEDILLLEEGIFTATCDFDQLNPFDLHFRLYPCVTGKKQRLKYACLKNSCV